MRTFAIYRNPKPYEAVKNGFSWPGFFFNWQWAFWKNMGGVTALLLVAILTPTGLRLYFKDSGEMFLAWLCAVGMLCLLLLVGFQGNAWRKKALVKRGYELIETIQAESPKDAIRQSSGFRREGSLSCQHCGKLNSGVASFCQFCGTATPRAQLERPAEVSDKPESERESEHIAV